MAMDNRRVGRPREVDDAEILSVARRCFLEKGGGLSVQAVAKEIGVSHTTLFNRFGSKEGLLLAALAAPRQLEVQARVEAGPTDAPIPEQLRELCVDLAMESDAVIRALGVLMAAGVPRERLAPDPDGSPMIAIGRAMGGWVARAMAAGRIREADVRAVVSTLMAGMHGYVHAARITGEPVTREAVAAHAASVVDVVWNGIDVGARTN